ncbi:extracellular solute-binding protein [Vibrio sp. SCSIO 43169]|nr:extracellular solute-binding protein [Vibrio sp. SCSIO 43169]MCM5511059.1 extracellular solute-binding protein [Vibrio sp. SCSIO 43169]
MNKLINEVLVDDFEEAGLNVNYLPVEGDFSQFIVNALSANTAPDAFYIDVSMAYALVQSGKVAENNNLLKAISYELVPSLNEAFTFSGRQFGLAKDFNTLALQYNKDIFDDASVAYPSDSDNWYDTLDKLKAIKKSLGNEVHGICLMPDYARFAPFALGAGWSPFNEQGKTVLDENFRRAFEFYTSLKSEGVGILASDIGQEWGGGCFGTEKTAITIEGNWISGYLRDKAPNLQYGSTMIPKAPSTGERGNLLFTVAWGINAQGKNVAAAQKAVQILTSEKAQSWVLISGLALPSRLSLTDSSYFYNEDPESELAKKVFFGASEGHVVPFSFGKFGSKWMQPINDALSSVLLDQENVTEALSKAQDKYNKM